jgi:GNAT superfamily N-acetyltransferase
MEPQPLPAGDAASAEAVVALLNRELGAGMYSTGDVLEDAADPRAGVWLLGRPLHGAAVARLMVAADAGYYARFGSAVTDLFTEKVGSFEALAVEPAWRHRGLGRALTTAALEWMWSQGCDAVLTLSWRSGAGDASAGLFRHLGFREGRTVNRFYYEESVRDGWICPVCHGPCTCAATAFWLHHSG